MALVCVRFFQFQATPNGRHVPQLGEIDGLDEEILDVNLARAVSVNALATPARTPIRYATLRHEARLLACLLIEGPGTAFMPPRLSLHEAFRASARHIRGFVSEGAGLGLLTAAAEEYFQWRSDPALLEHFDALPMPLESQYKTKGSRPDLLFNLGDGLGSLAGEAKGRFPHSTEYGHHGATRSLDQAPSLESPPRRSSDPAELRLPHRTRHHR